MSLFVTEEISCKISIFDQCSLSTERPLGTPVCSVQSVNNTELQYQCQWLAGTPPAQLSFSVLNESNSGAGILSLNVTAVNTLNGKTVTCIADHPVEKNNCDITARKSQILNDHFEVCTWSAMSLLSIRKSSQLSASCEHLSWLWRQNSGQHPLCHWGIAQSCGAVDRWRQSCHQRDHLPDHQRRHTA